MKKRIAAMVLVLLCFGVLLACPVSFASDRIEVQYLKTSDGDTARFQINGQNERVRFLGINTPEVSGENKVEEPYGNEALLYTQKRLENARKIEIEYDSVADHEDRYGRKLAWIWLDDELLEIDLLEKGLAKTYMLKDNYKYAKELKQAELVAKENKIGLWSEEEVIVDQNTILKEMLTNEEETETKLDQYVIMICVLIVIIYIIMDKLKKKK